MTHDDVIKWRHFPRYWPFVRGIHRSPVNSPHKGQWRGALMFSLICVWINDWVNDREAGDLRRNRVHYDAIVMYCELDTAQLTWELEACRLLWSSDFVLSQPTTYDWRLVFVCWFVILAYCTFYPVTVQKCLIETSNRRYSLYRPLINSTKLREI